MTHKDISNCTIPTDLILSGFFDDYEPTLQSTEDYFEKILTIRNDYFKYELVNEFIKVIFDNLREYQKEDTINPILNLIRKYEVEESLLILALQNNSHLIDPTHILEYSVQYSKFSLFESIYDTLLFDIIGVNDNLYSSQHDLDTLNHYVLENSNNGFLIDYLEKFKDSVLLNTFTESSIISTLTNMNLSEDDVIEKLEILTKYGLQLDLTNNTDSYGNILLYSLDYSHIKLFDYALDNNFLIKRDTSNLKYLLKAIPNQHMFSRLLDKYNSVFKPLLNTSYSGATLLSRAVLVDNVEFFNYCLNDLSLDLKEPSVVKAIIESDNSYYMDVLLKSDLLKSNLKLITKSNYIHIAATLLRNHNMDIFKQIINSDISFKNHLISTSENILTNLYSLNLSLSDLNNLKQFLDIDIDIRVFKDYLNRISDSHIDNIDNYIEFFTNNIKEPIEDNKFILDAIIKSNNIKNCENLIVSLSKHCNIEKSITTLDYNVNKERLYLYVEYGLIKDINNLRLNSDILSFIMLGNNNSAFSYNNNKIFYSYLQENGFSFVRTDDLVNHLLQSFEYIKLNNYCDLIEAEGINLTSVDMDRLFVNLTSIMSNSHSKTELVYKVLNTLNEVGYSYSYIYNNLNEKNQNIFKVKFKDININSDLDKQYYEDKTKLLSSVDTIKLSSKDQFNALKAYKSIVESDHDSNPILPITGSFIKDEQINKKLFEPLFKKKLIEVDLVKSNSTKDLN